MGTGFLIDTSAVIKYLNEVFPPEGMERMDAIFVLPPQISVVTRVELLSWNPAKEEDLRQFEAFVAAAQVLSLTEEIILRTITVRKAHRLKLPDAFIAATALALGATLVADNDRDFLKIPGLDYLNPARLT